MESFSLAYALIKGCGFSDNLKQLKVILLNVFNNLNENLVPEQMSSVDCSWSTR